MHEREHMVIVQAVSRRMVTSGALRDMCTPGGLRIHLRSHTGRCRGPTAAHVSGATGGCAPVGGPALAAAMAARAPEKSSFSSTRLGNDAVPQGGGNSQTFADSVAEKLSGLCRTLVAEYEDVGGVGGQFQGVDMVLRRGSAGLGWSSAAAHC